MTTATATPTVKVIPNVGDLIISSHNTTVGVFEVTEVKRKTTTGGRRLRWLETERLASSYTFRRKRCFVRGEESIEAKDFTAGRVYKGYGPWLINKYAPDLAGRNVFRRTYNGDEYLGKVADVKPESETKKKTMPPRSEWKMVPGAILYTSWGYDQTNVEYYEIVKRKGWFVWVQEIGSTDASDGNEPWMTGKSLPNPESRVGEILRRKLRVDTEGKEVPSIKINSVCDAYLWDGKKMNWTSYA